MALQFEWNRQKARDNLRKHGVSFDEAPTVFGDPLSLTVEDPDRSLDEDRLATLGMSNQRRLIVVVHAARLWAIRLISAREATAQKWRAYEEA